MISVNIRKNLAKITESVLKATDMVLHNANIQSSSIRDIKVKSTNTGFEVLFPEHFAYINDGRRPGKQPPLNTIIDWINKSRISVPSGMKVKQFAFLIARSIGRRGVKPRPFLETLSEELGSIIADYISDEFNNNRL